MPYYMAGYGNNYERCRFCGLDLPADSASALAHYNHHWRQCNLQNLSSCAYEPELNIRMGHASLNSEDLEVSGHLDHTSFEYSPQTEPSNLSLARTRCSPLNLTGRPKAESPITSPLASPLPNENQQPQSFPMSLNTHHNAIQSVEMQSNVDDDHAYSNFSNGMFNSCGIPLSSQIVPLIQNGINSVDLNCHNQNINGYCLIKKKRKFDKSEFTCLGCNRIFLTRSSLDEHTQMYHSKNNAPHSNHYSLNNESIDLNNTITEVDSCSKPFKCSICDQEFMFREQLLEHANNHEASKPYRCDLCGTGLSHLSALRRHILSHSGHKPHICEICNRGFYQKCDLLRHYSVHGKKRESQCNHCKKKYTSDYFLKNHKCKPPEEPKPYKCNICGNSCSTDVAWSYHMWKHTKNPKFVPFQSQTGITGSFNLTSNYTETVSIGSI